MTAADRTLPPDERTRLIPPPSVHADDPWSAECVPLASLLRTPTGQARHGWFSPYRGDSPPGRHAAPPGTVGGLLRDDGTRETLLTHETRRVGPPLVLIGAVAFTLTMIAWAVIVWTP